MRVIYVVIDLMTCDKKYWLKWEPSLNGTELNINWNLARFNNIVGLSNFFQPVFTECRRGKWSICSFVTDLIMNNNNNNIRQCTQIALATNWALACDMRISVMILIYIYVYLIHIYILYRKTCIFILYKCFFKVKIE